MNFEKIKYCRCTKCHKHGIRAFKKIGYKYNPQVECKYCNSKFSVNFALSLMMKIFILMFWGILGFLFKTYIIEIPLPIWCALGIISLFVFEYFCPMEEL